MHEIGGLISPIALKFGRPLGNTTVGKPAKLQSDMYISTHNLAGSRLTRRYDDTSYQILKRSTVL